MSDQLERYEGGLRPTILWEVKARLDQMHLLNAHRFTKEYEVMCGEIIDIIHSRLSKEAVTIQTLLIASMMSSMQVDADIVVTEFLGGIGDYEREIAERENIDISNL